MKNALLLLLLTWSSFSSAYTFKEENKPISSQKALSDAAKIGLAPSAADSLARQEIRTWSDRTKKRHLESGAPDPLVMEVQKPRPNFVEAKVIAQQQLFRGVEKHWNRIKDSAFNEPAVDTFEKFAPYLKRDLEKLELIDSRDTKGYLFALPWADIRVDKKLKKVTWVIRIGSHLDGNRLQEGVEEIIIPERSAE